MVSGSWKIYWLRELRSLLTRCSSKTIGTGTSQGLLILSVPNVCILPTGPLCEQHMGVWEGHVSCQSLCPVLFSTCLSTDSDSYRCGPPPGESTCPQQHPPLSVYAWLTGGNTTTPVCREYSQDSDSFSPADNMYACSLLIKDTRFVKLFGSCKWLFALCC